MGQVRVMLLHTWYRLAQGVPLANKTARTRSAFFFIDDFWFPSSGQAVVTGVAPSPPPVRSSLGIAQRV